MRKKKLFKIAREGATTDGRKISRVWIEQMASNYDPKVYGARINIEHIKSFSPDSTFRAYGDVLALSTKEEDGVLYLMAELSPTDELKELTKKRQKLYTSLEVNASFADTGEAYLVGLAVTDSPASLGTEMLEFAAKQAVNVFATRKQSPDNLFTAAEEVVFNFDDEAEEKGNFLENFKQLFAKKQTGDQKQAEEFKAALTLCAEEINALKETAANYIADQAAFTQLKTDHAALSDQFKQLQKKIEATPINRFRTTPTDGDAEALTDC